MKATEDMIERGARAMWSMVRNRAEESAMWAAIERVCAGAPWFALARAVLEAVVPDLCAQLAEAEAQIAAMRAALEDVDALHRAVLGEPSERVDDLTPLQVWERVRAALSSDAGRAMLERLRDLEEEVETLRNAAWEASERC